MCVESTNACVCAGLSYNVAGSGDAAFPPERKHGLLGMMGWGVLMPIGMITARYFRQLDPCWFYTHMAIQVAGYAVGIAGIVLGFRLSEDGLRNVDVHKALGIAILAMASLQVRFFVRQRKKNRKLSELLVDNTGEIEYKSLIICTGHFRFARHMRTV